VGRFLFECAPVGKAMGNGRFFYARSALLQEHFCLKADQMQENSQFGLLEPCKSSCFVAYKVIFSRLKAAEQPIWSARALQILPFCCV